MIHNLSKVFYLKEVEVTLGIPKSLSRAAIKSLNKQCLVGDYIWRIKEMSTRFERMKD